MIDAFHLYINASEIHSRRASGWGGRRIVTELMKYQWNSKDLPTLTLDQLEPSAKWRGRFASLSVYIGSACCKLMVVDLPAQINEPEQIAAVAASQMEYQMGISRNDWEFTVDNRMSNGKAIACAIRSDLVKHLKQVSLKQGVRLISIQPFFVSVWNQFVDNSADQSHRTLFAVEDDALTVISMHERIISSINNFLHLSNSLLIEKEIKRVSAMLQSGPSREVYIAQSKKTIVTNFPELSVTLDRNIKHSSQLKSDFSDLLLNQTTSTA